MTTIADIFDLPERVHQGDFVLRLAEGVEHAEQTLRDYVVTPQLAQCFDAALALIGSAVQGHTSKGAYLHGSFGSGKSHFMAVLTLLLQGDARARSIPELASAVAQSNSWTAGRRFLVAPYHLIGAASMESAVLGGYSEHVRRLHPEAPTPGFYQAEPVFADARRLRATMGDAAFFDALNAAVGDGSEGAGEGWGALASDWDAAGFGAALAAAPGDEERIRLTGDLIDAFFGAMRAPDTTAGERFVELDQGLAVMARHAQALGYDALILFLDELILWLASHAADPAFVSREGQKIAKLVESARADRPIPIVSFIARQRDLRELVGEHLPGADQLGFADVLDWWEARFDRITLEDRNLPMIVERRLLRPKDAAARAKLEAAFDRTARVREEVLATLLTRDGDRAMFRQVYPFTPALVQALIAVSSLLQRERTALKLMLQLLVEQAGRLQLGDVIPVGDLFDVIAEGDEPFTQAMRMRFDDARKLYRTKLRPLLEDEHGMPAGDEDTATADASAAARFRSDDRLLKTLLLAAIADGVEALRALTPARLAALNHGTVRSPIPGQESQIVLDACRRWAAQVGELKISDDSANPVISLQIVGVDTESILENAAALDNAGNRIQKVRQILYDGFGITASGDLLPERYELLWRGTRRTCEIMFRNVRELSAADLRNPGRSWQIVIDWPFDEPQRTPADDRAKIQHFLDTEDSTDTLVWLPSFFTPAAQRDLGRLVLLDQVLTGNRLNECGAHLSQTDRDQARLLLANQRDQMRARIGAYLLAAYGISGADAGAVDQSHELDEHFVSLNQQYPLRPPVAAGFRQALDDIFSQALASQYPEHPEFSAEVRRSGLRHVLEVVERAVAHPEERVEVARNVRDEVRNIVTPLELGDMGETHFKLGRRWVDELDRKHAQHGGESLTVGELRAWIEAPERRGLPIDLQNLVIMAFAAQKGYRFTVLGTPAPAAIDKLDDQWELEAHALPTAADYERAVQRAESVFGVAASPVLAPGNVHALAQSVREAAAAHRAPVDALAAALQQRLEVRTIPVDQSDRMRSVAAIAALLSALRDVEDDALAATLAAVEVPTSEVAMAAVLKEAPTLTNALAPHRWTVFDKLTVLAAPYQSQVTDIGRDLNDALQRDEHVIPLANAVQQCETRAVNLLAEAAAAAGKPPPTIPVPPPVKPPPAGAAGAEHSAGRDVTAENVAGVFEEIRVAIRETGGTRVAIHWRVYSDPNGASQ